mmetsp:Transcript_8210/g.23449  ORF Transcript_8210/g.23449 Transcript_8210/m.23449 type:complete len:159 (+) Transcript_8210:98-574(+)
MVAARKVLLVISACVGAVAADSLAISSAEIDQALGEDEVCRGDAVECALNALQVRASSVVAEEGEAMGACETGIVAQIAPLAPGCFKGCPEACGPLGTAINAYLTKGGKTAAKAEICKHKKEFSCAYRHWSDCKVLAVQAGTLGLDIPMSQKAMDSEC